MQQRRRTITFHKITVLLSVLILSGHVHSGIIFRSTLLSVDGGDYGGPVNASQSRPSVNLENADAYQLAFIFPVKDSHHIYARYQSLDADGYTTNTFHQTGTKFKKKTFDIGLFVPSYMKGYYIEWLGALRYDSIEHDINARYLTANYGSLHQQDLWGIHAGSRIFFPLAEKWQLSTGLAVNLMFGDRDSEYVDGAVNSTVKERKNSQWGGLDGELALHWQPNTVLSLQAGYSYSIMLDYIQQDLYAPNSLSNTAPQNKGEANYIEQGPFIEVGIDF